MKTSAPPLLVVPPEPSWLPLVMLLLALVVLMLVAAACEGRPGARRPLPPVYTPEIYKFGSIQEPRRGLTRAPVFPNRIFRALSKGVADGCQG